MKRIKLTLLFATIFSGIILSQSLSPYTMGAISDLDLPASVRLVKKNLENSGFQVLGEYAPAGDSDRWLIIITSDELLDAAAETGGLTGFAAALRIGLTMENGRVAISYTTPEYWMNAYYRDDYEKVEASLAPVSERLNRVMQECGSFSGTSFGSEEGMEAADLRSYRYMAGMQKFDNTVELGNFSSYQAAIDKIESSLIKGVNDVSKVYSVQIPGKEIKLYGFALGGEKGEPEFLPIIDISEPKHTAFLPYEFLVMGNEVHMLHGRFRIALSFPDLTMGTFMKIRSTPGNIKDLLKSVVE